MTKKDIYYTNTAAGHIIVERIKNDIDGNPRHRVTILSGVGSKVATSYTVKRYDTAADIAREELDKYSKATKAEA